MPMNPDYPNLPILRERDMAILLDEDLKRYPHGRRFTICRACREIYHATTDEEIKRKCKYISMLASAITRRLEQYDAEWLRAVYPRRHEFDSVMKASDE